MARIRVLHVVATNQRRGGEIFASDLVRALGGLGIAQRVVVLRPSGKSEINYDVLTEELRSSSQHDWLHDLNPQRLAAVRRLVRRWQPQVIQAHGGEAMRAAVLARTNIPIVYRRIGGAPPALRHGLRRRAYQHLIGRTTKVVAVAEAVRRESIGLLGVPPARIVTIPNAVDPERLVVTVDRPAMRATLGIDDSAPVLLSLGALSWEKNPLAHLRVGTRVLGELARAVHLFAGDGPMRPRLEQVVASLGLEDRVRILGIRGDVPNLLAAADLLLLASRPDGMEGMPAVVIEAGMLRTPSVAYDVAGVGDVVTDGLTGRLVPWGEECALSDAMLEVLGDAAARDAMGDAARQRCVAEFSIEQVAPQYLRLYQEVLAR